MRIYRLSSDIGSDVEKCPFFTKPTSRRKEIDRGFQFRSLPVSIFIYAFTHPVIGLKENDMVRHPAEDMVTSLTDISQRHFAYEFAIP